MAYLAFSRSTCLYIVYANHNKEDRRIKSETRPLIHCKFGTFYSCRELGLAQRPTSTLSLYDDTRSRFRCFLFFTMFDMPKYARYWYDIIQSVFTPPVYIEDCQKRCFHGIKKTIKRNCIENDETMKLWGNDSVQRKYASYQGIKCYMHLWSGEKTTSLRN